MTVSDQFDIRKVDYVLNGPGLEDASLGSGYRSAYGWIGAWNTLRVPNGSYTIGAKVSDSGGRTVMATPVEVRVENRTSTTPMP